MLPLFLISREDNLCIRLFLHPRNPPKHSTPSWFVFEYLMTTSKLRSYLQLFTSCLDLRHFLFGLQPSLLPPDTFYSFNGADCPVLNHPQILSWVFPSLLFFISRNFFSLKRYSFAGWAESKEKHGVRDPMPELTISSPYVYTPESAATHLPYRQPYARIDYTFQSGT